MNYMVVWFWLWLILAASLFIGEMITVTLILLPFAIGATAAWLANIIGLSLGLQWFCFAVVSIVALVSLRPLAARLTRGSNVRAGVDRLVGMDAAIVDQPAPAGMRRAKVDGELWNVILEPGFESLTEDLAVDERVYVMQIDGTRLVVRRYQ